MNEQRQKALARRMHHELKKGASVEDLIEALGIAVMMKLQDAARVTNRRYRRELHIFYPSAVTRLKRVRHQIARDGEVARLRSQGGL